MKPNRLNRLEGERRRTIIWSLGHQHPEATVTGTSTHFNNRYGGTGSGSGTGTVTRFR